MSTFVGDYLTTTALSLLAIDRAVERRTQAIVICTIDEHGWPHPAMLSSLEVVAYDARNVRLATHISSRTTRNLRANGKLSLIVADAQGVFYIKGDVLLLSPSMRTAPQLSRFNMRVDSVLEDSPRRYENARVVSGITVDRDVADAEPARMVLDELLSD
jgi:hypothetical protein